MDKDQISRKIIGCAIEVHKQLGPGLLESVYQECLYYELTLAGLHVQREVKMPIKYKGIDLEVGYRIDLLVNDLVVIEVKSVEEYSEIFLAQTLTYLRLADKRLGLILNFNVIRLVDGVTRVINGY